MKTVIAAIALCLALGGPAMAAGPYEPTYNALNIVGIAGLNLGLSVTQVFTGPTAASVGLSANLINITSDNAAITAPGGAFLSALTVQDLNFGGPAAEGGRIMGNFEFTQTAPSMSTGAGNPFQQYIGVFGFAKTLTGDGGTSGAPAGFYFGGWSVAELGPSATFVEALAGHEIDISAASGSSVANKTGLYVTHTSGDVALGSVNDNSIWMAGYDATHGANIGIQFGRSDITANGGVNTGGALIAEVGAYTYLSGIDFSQATFTGDAWKSVGATLSGAGGLTVAGLTDSGLASGATSCVEVNNLGAFSITGAPCGSGSGAVNSVNDPTGTLTVSPTTGVVDVGINLAHANTWMGVQTLQSPVINGAGSFSSINATVAADATTVTKYNSTGTSTSPFTYDQLVTQFAAQNYTVPSYSVNAVFGGIIQNNNSAVSFPTGVTGYAVLNTATNGNAAFGMFAECDAFTKGSCLGLEINNFNEIGNANTTFPPVLSYPISTNEQIGEQIIGYGAFTSKIALYIASQVFNGGVGQYAYQAGIYMGPAAANDYGIFVDANSSVGPVTSARFDTAGVAQTNLYLQSHGVLTSGDYIDAVNSAGASVFTVALNGVTTIADPSTSDTGALIINAASDTSGANVQLSNGSGNNVFMRNIGGVFELLNNGYSLATLTVTQTGGLTAPGAFTANGTTAVSLTALAPSAAHATVQEWLTISDGTNTRYIPVF